MNSQLKQLSESLPVIQKIFPDDACFVLADIDKVLEYLPGEKIDIKIPVGAPIENFKGTVSYEAYETGKTCREERGPELFGIAYISTATPIKENGEVIGVISAIVSNERFDTLRRGAVELTAISEELSATSEEMTKLSDVTARDLQSLAEESNMIKDEVKHIEEILDIIKKTSIKSRILGLNASIESARAGEAGKGFAIVASEIKKMADNSKEAIEGIEPEVKRMVENLEKINATVNDLSSQTEEQSAMIEEFHSSFEHLVHIASALSEKANLEE
ncbi:methyl-accepting chemotaxis protein [Bacillus massilinigeriensis]|uniref:methyl-accepting chemotaxis protein n=1 Tax=Bacillus massilionigeriensis TaxID=1805475 RepID=UPI00096B3D12|nr:methyl-accepting chemotaxis protein [Bacillus massilionigeriensis]